MFTFAIVDNEFIWPNGHMGHACGLHQERWGIKRGGESKGFNAFIFVWLMWLRYDEGYTCLV